MDVLVANMQALKPYTLQLLAHADEMAPYMNMLAPALPKLAPHMAEMQPHLDILLKKLVCVCFHARACMCMCVFGSVYAC